MIDFEFKPCPGEDENTFTKRKAYYIRLLCPRIRLGTDNLNKKLNNLKPLSAGDRKEIDALWAHYLTPSQRDQLIDYRWYESYNKVLREGERLCDYMPDEFYFTFIDEYFTNPQHSNLCDDKNLYDLYFHDINRPEVIFRKMHNLFLDGDYNEITLEKAIALASEKSEVILKVGKFSFGGHGVLFWDSTKGDSLLKDYLLSSENIICQNVIKQHSELNRLNPRCVHTIRVMSLLFHDKVHVLSSVLRMGINGARVDNASSGGIFCGIKPDGQLKNVAYDYAVNVYPRHPQGTAFESVVIPNFSECISIVTSLAKRFCIISNLISWDFAIGEDGHPILIEFNVSCGGVNTHQLCNGPIFGDLTEEVLDDVFKNSYTLNSILKSM